MGPVGSVGLVGPQVYIFFRLNMLHIFNSLMKCLETILSLRCVAFHFFCLGTSRFRGTDGTSRTQRAPGEYRARQDCERSFKSLLLHSLCSQ